jgi:hypothetical protein
METVLVRVVVVHKTSEWDLSNRDAVSVANVSENGKLHERTLKEDARSPETIPGIIVRSLFLLVNRGPRRLQSLITRRCRSGRLDLDVTLKFKSHFEQII